MTAGFGLNPQQAADQSSAQSQQETKKLQELLEKLYGRALRHDPLNMSATGGINPIDALAHYKVLGSTPTTVSAVLPTGANAPIIVSKDAVHCDLAQLSDEARMNACFEMALLAMTNPALMEQKGGFYLHGDERERAMLFIAAKKLGFESKIANAPANIPQDLITLTAAQWPKFESRVSGTQSSFHSAASGARPAPTPRDDFDNGDIGSLLGRYANYDASAAERIKTRVLALFKYEQTLGTQFLPRFKDNIDLKSLSPESKLDDLFDQHPNAQKFLQEARNEVDSRVPAPKGFPFMGQFIDNYKLADQDTKNNLLIAQAAVRTLARVARLEAGQPEKEQSPAKANLSFIGKNPNEPAELRHAQETYKNATELEQNLVDHSAECAQHAVEIETFKRNAISSLEIAAHGLQGQKAHTALTGILETYKPTPPAAAPAPFKRSI